MEAADEHRTWGRLKSPHFTFHLATKYLFKSQRFFYFLERWPALIPPPGSVHIYISSLETIGALMSEGLRGAAEGAGWLGTETPTATGTGTGIAPPPVFEGIPLPRAAGVGRGKGLCVSILFSGV